MRELMDSRKHVVSPLKVISGTVVLTAYDAHLQALTGHTSQHYSA